MTSASVVVDGRTVGQIDEGLVVLVGVTHEDTTATAATLARKVHELRILPDERSCAETGAGLLVVSQFTLYGDCQKGRRPSFIDAARPEVAEPLYLAFADVVRSHGVPVATGRFGANMQVELVNDGPVTLVLDTP